MGVIVQDQEINNLSYLLYFVTSNVTYPILFNVFSIFLMAVIFILYLKNQILQKLRYS